MTDSNATYNFSVNADLPDYGAGIVSFENVQYFTSGNNEILAGQTYELTLDANGEGTQVLPAPDNTGTLAVNWVIGLPSGESVRAALSYSAGAQELSDILANASTTTDPDTITAALANKQNRDTDAVANNLARMNASGDAEDSSIPASWNATDMTMDITHNANVTGQVNQEFFVLARNNSGSNITNGQVVKLTGSVSSRPTIALAQADSVANARQIGVATEDIDNNGTGFVTVAGLVRGLNTSAYNEGDVLYLSTSVAGAFTATKPTWPSIAIEVGIVVVKNATLGSIFVGAYETGAGAHEKAAAAQAAAEAASQPLSTALTEIASISPSTGDLISDNGGWIAATPSAAPGAVADVILKTGSGGKLEIVQLGIGKDPGSLPLSIYGANGEIRAQSSLSDDTNKIARFTVANYDNDTPTPVLLFGGNSQSAASSVSFGGGASTAYAATTLNFYAAANHTTTTGTIKMNLSIDGVSIGDGLVATSAAELYVRPATDKVGLRVRAQGTQTNPVLQVNNSANQQRFAVYESGIVVFYDVWATNATMGDSTKTVGTDAPVDWLEIEISGLTRYIPCYTA